MISTETVLYSVAGGVATVTLNRPDRLNAWTREMGEGWSSALARAGADPEVRAGLATGAGPRRQRRARLDGGHRAPGLRPLGDRPGDRRRGVDQADGGIPDDPRLQGGRGRLRRAAAA